MFAKGKINTVRTVALVLCFGGIIITYGSFLVESMWAMALFMCLGLLMIILSTVTYFAIGYLSTKAVYVICPTCEKQTKVLGRVDECMFCKQKLTLDPAMASTAEAAQKEH
jgi:hypothetical protein